MTTLSHLWSVLCFLTAVSAVLVRYPSINSSETLTCTCPDHQCQKVLWYRLLHNSGTPEFLVSTNNLNNAHYAEKLNQGRFRTTASDEKKVLYTLRITGIQNEDAGFYSCVLVSQNSAQDPKDLMPEGYYIRPGVVTNTLAPATVKNPRHVNRPGNNCKPISLKGCKSLVLWSGIGAVLLLGVILILTLYYFSRLPKKCRHHFAKKHQLK
ncbi:LOW QUALITY PROTEIN: uncharacterized protein cd8b [Silurus meridionalis]|uniref:LOW QUALITY PROTEIN: uncharacterized protein cd8b n=1 Tax=Silurus meridionalis TaxID=175797 RepID=UPI001EEBA164|nr:LOW QUALITY PROTEIN: uncharacterized protein cd8b [Silurus meridionalis]